MTICRGPSSRQRAEGHGSLLLPGFSEKLRLTISPEIAHNAESNKWFIQYITLVSSWSWVRDGCSLPHAESALQWPLGTGPLLCVSVEAAGGFPITHSCVSVMMRKDGTPRLLGGDTGHWWGSQMLPDRPPTPPSGYSFIPAASSDQWLHRHCEWWPLRNRPHLFGILKWWFFFLMWPLSLSMDGW